LRKPFIDTARNQMDARIIEQAEYCRVFSNTKRILILWVLGDEEMSVSDIASTLNTSLQNTSQHLRVMKDRGILRSRRDGQTKYYRVADGNCLVGSNPISMNTLPLEQTKIVENQYQEVINER
jgi:DNA-binding transcriptional ArsR family regulator